MVILWLYIGRLRQARAAGGAVALLLTILSIDAFRTLFESAYFGLYFNSMFGFLPRGVFELLSLPTLIIIPKLLNVFAGLIVLFLLIRRWIPQDLRYREESIQNLKEAKLLAEKEKKEAEQQASKFAAIFNGISDAIVFTDTNRRIISVNRGMEKTFGYTIDDLVGKTTAVLYESVEDYERQGRIRFNMTAEEKNLPYELNYRRKNGQVFVGETLGTVINGPNGEVLGFIGVIRDVTERKQGEEKLRKAKKEAEHANRAKSEFLASMSHELRTPLNAVLGFAQLLQFDPKYPLSSHQNAHVESIIEGGSHLLELVNEILDLAKIEADQIDLVLEEVNANDVVEECVAMTAPLGKPRRVTIANQFSRGPSTQLHTDHKRLKQALINLLSNAIKYNKDGGQVIVSGVETEDGFLRLSVTDTGIGIAEKSQRSVFNMFRRLSSDPMVSTEGTGIGLAVTKLLAERMAGHIGFESHEGVGSTFWIELPLTSNKNVIIWSDALRIGVDALDKDHQVLITLLNKAARRGKDDTNKIDIIDKLIDYTHFHFRREEAIMEICAHPDLEKHRSLHQSPSAQLNDIARAYYQDRDQQASAQLQDFIKEWLLTHIMQTDMDIAPYTKGKEQDIRKALESLN